MASINQGDDAVERLDNAVTAFEQIMTGPEGQMVPVPGHPAQPTLAERVKQNLKPSTDAAAGYAAQASASAKAADESAKLASQISGLSTVADAIGLAALPLPDVWAPFSDSLRMITGYGREVKVGDDVVARMVNFSRNSTATYIGKDGQLKTAAANEPRFEKDGLLIEGQSTNLIVRSQQFRWRDGNGPSPGVQSPSTDPQSSALIPMVDVSPDRRRPLFDGILTVGKTYTISFRAKSSGGTISQLASRLTGAVYPAVRADEWTTYSFTGVASTSSVDFQITGDSVSIAWIQAEELPFASSYIATGDAAVTRAGDIVNIPWAMNINPQAVTVAMNYDLLGVGQANQRIIEYSESVNPRYMVQMTPSGVLQSFAAAAPLSISGAPYSARSTFASATSPSRHSVKVSGRDVASYITEGPARYRPTIPLGAGSVGQDPMFGHMRNLRIWHRALTDDQLKAVA
jgi:hypothetical protein